MDIDISKYIPGITIILLNSDLNTVSAWDVRSRLEQNYNIDLTSRKNEVKKIVQLCYDKICGHEEKETMERNEEEKGKREGDEYDEGEIAKGNDDDMAEDGEEVEEIEEVVASGEAIMYNVTYNHEEELED
ncbi:hypothetical protein Glove_144g135 [Diversispora epigaea]|uniref:DEK-C domain-containing protein n=1 Tax=Diversispora epigaea TaxID=1348612 RepID=A0A397IWY5_9GLOM|nr:hypothetical protein Glove_144g135 [Diversispora epigaea]